MMQKAWSVIEKVPYCFSEVIGKMQITLADKSTIWIRRVQELEAMSQLSDTSDLPC